MFFDTKPEKQNTKFEKIEFMRFDPGTHTVRIIGKPVGMYSHYMPAQKISIKCNGESCVICKNNKQLIMEYPDSFRTIKGWNPRQYRHYFNVVDKTPVKVCPNCGFETKRSPSFPVSCPTCNTMIPSSVVEHPSGKIKLASISDTNANLINTQAMGVLDQNGEPLDFSNYDFMFTVVRVDGKKSIIPSALPANTAPVEYDESKLYDLARAVVTLFDDEVKDLLKGVSLKDIFAARKLKNDPVQNSEDTDKEAQESVLSAVDNLFGEAF